MSKRIMAKVVMYKKNPCPYCDRAVSFLEERGIKVEMVDLTGNYDEMDRIKNETGWRTFPIIMINDKLVGGYTDMKNLDEEGKLMPMLEA